MGLKKNKTPPQAQQQQLPPPKKNNPHNPFGSQKSGLRRRQEDDGWAGRFRERLGPRPGGPAGQGGLAGPRQAPPAAVGAPVPKPARPARGRGAEAALRAESGSRARVAAPAPSLPRSGRGADAWEKRLRGAPPAAPAVCRLPPSPARLPQRGGGRGLQRPPPDGPVPCSAVARLPRAAFGHLCRGLPAICRPAPPLPRERAASHPPRSTAPSPGAECPKSRASRAFAPGLLRLGMYVRGRGGGRRACASLRLALFRSRLLEPIQTTPRVARPGPGAHLCACRCTCP